ncbi:MAG: IS5/IS1182 family transposase, partial [Bacteroidota bacterium]
CIAKGKAHRQYEFGNKVGIATTMGKRIVITAVDAFRGNPNDGTTIVPLLQQCQSLHRHCPKEVVYDRGGKVKGGKVGETTVWVPAPPLKSDNAYKKRKKRKKFRARAAIEPVISHLKKNFRMQENYLMGEKAPKINAMLAATG